MAEAEQPQIYLVTPSDIDPADFPEQLGTLLDAVDIACVRIELASDDEDVVARACDAIRLVAHARDVPVVVTDHVGLVERLGLDGVHLRDGARSVRKVRKELGGDAIIGAFCGATRHDGLTAGESGADYVSFGPLRETGLGHGDLAEMELFSWWSEMIEVPIVAEGAIDLETARALSGITDFIALGGEIWGQDDPLAALKDYVSALS